MLANYSTWSFALGATLAFALGGAYIAAAINGVGALVFFLIERRGA